MNARGSHPSLDLILSGDPPDFAIIYRPAVSGEHMAEVLCGRSKTYQELADISSGPHGKTLVLVPFRQAAERGFTVIDDGTELVAMEVDSHSAIPLADLLKALPDDEVRVENGGFETDGAAYIEQIREIIDEEIGRGEGSNFVIKRSYTGKLADYGLRTALTLYRRLVESENGAYWTFLVRAAGRILIGASPERHLSCENGVAVMNPISGTYRYPPSGPDIEELVDFLSDEKETDELNMVVDEELKMMTRICDQGPWITGPHLREMAHLAHTEYYIQGHTSRSPVDLLRETLFAPTVVGSPLENAFRVIARREKSGRGYYSGCVALIGHDQAGRETLDSAILIRTAEIEENGRIVIGVGTTLVRHSNAESEVAETESKVAGLLSVLNDGNLQRRASPAVPRGLGTLPNVVGGLASRNSRLARFWLTPCSQRQTTAPQFDGHRALVLDAEDTFTCMLAHQLRSLELDVTVSDVRGVELAEMSDYQLVVLGPGPGDPRDDGDPKIVRMRELLGHARGAGLPLLAVCLGHQVLCRYLGLNVVRLDVPNQGAQRQIALFGAEQRVGFYNTFVAVSQVDSFQACGMAVEVSRDSRTGHVHALRAPGMRSLQFHPESILTQSGVDVLVDCLSSLIPVWA